MTLLRNKIDFFNHKSKKCKCQKSKVVVDPLSNAPVIVLRDARGR